MPSDLKPIPGFVENRGKKHKERTYWSKSSDHTMTKDPRKYGATGELRVSGVTIQFRFHAYTTNKATIIKYIEASSDWGTRVFATPQEAGVEQAPTEKVVSMIGANVGDMTPTEKGIKEGGQRSYKATDVEFEEPPANAPEDLPEASPEE